MSLEVIKTQIREFLRSKEPEVLAIRGDWGVGKTFTWDETLQEAQQQKFNDDDAGAIGLTYYSYVSLFGISSLQDLRTEIAFNKLNTIDLKHAEGVTRYKKLSGKFAPKIISQLIQTTGISAGTLVDTMFASVSNSMIKDTIVCIDDFERSTIDEKEALGFINDLKCKRGCKVVILLNDTHTEQFKTYREKVIDYDINFKTTPIEAISMALKNHEEKDYHKYIFEHCEKIGTTNVRVIKKIRALTENMLSKVSIPQHRQEVLRIFLQTSTLAHYCFYQSKESIPDIDFLLNNDEYSPLLLPDMLFGEESENLTDRQKSQKKKYSDRYNFLTSYGKDQFDRFDESIISSVVDGFIEKTSFEKWLLEKISEIENDKSSFLLNKMINCLYSKVMDDQEVENWAEEFVKISCEKISYVSKWQLNNSYHVLTKLGHIEKRNKILSSYIDKNSNFIFMFDTDTSTDLQDVNWVPELKDILDEEYRRKNAPPTPKDILNKMIYQKGSIQRHELEILTHINEDAVSEILKSLSPDSFRGTVAALTHITTIHPELRGLETNTHSVLRKIAKESNQGRLLAEHYGIRLEDD